MITRDLFTADFEANALLWLRQDKLRRLRNQLADKNSVEYAICQYLESLESPLEFVNAVKELLHAKSGAKVRGFVLPDPWETKPDVVYGFGATEASKLYNMLQSLRKDSESQKTLLSAKAFIKKVEALLVIDEDDAAERRFNFQKIRELLAHWELHDGPFAEVETWLRYQLVRLFRDMLGDSLKPDVFLDEFNSLDSDSDGVEKAIADDYIYRYALPYAQDDALKTWVTPYLKQYKIPVMTSRFADRSYIENTEDISLVKTAIADRVKAFGSSATLKPLLRFDEFYQEKQNWKPVKPIELPVTVETKMVASPVVVSVPPVVVEDGVGALPKAGAVMGAVIGFWVGLVLLGPAGAAVGLVLGMMLCVALGFAASKLAQCVSTKKPPEEVPVIDPVKVTHNQELSQFYSQRKKQEVSTQPVVRQSGVGLATGVFSPCPPVAGPLPDGRRTVLKP